MYSCKKKDKFVCATLNVRSPNWETNCVSNNTRCLTPQEICKCLKFKPPPPPTCVNNYITKKKRKKKNSKLTVEENAEQVTLDKEQSKHGTQSNTEYSSNPTTSSHVTTSVSNANHGSKPTTNYSATSYDPSTTKNSSATTSSQQNGTVTTTDKTTTNNTSDDSKDTEKVCCETCTCQQIKPVEYIEYEGIPKRRRHRMDYLTGPPQPIILDTTPNYYAKVDAQKTTSEFYFNYLNCQLWKMHLPKPPILLGANINHLNCFINEHDYLYKYLQQKAKLEAQQKKRNKKK